MQSHTSQPSTSSSTPISSPLMYPSRASDESSAQMTDLPVADHGYHYAANSDNVDEPECLCRATFSDDIASKYSEQQTGIKLHLCICHIQDVSEDPWLSLTEENAPRSDYLAVPSSPLPEA